MIDSSFEDAEIPPCMNENNARSEATITLVKENFSVFGLERNSKFFSPIFMVQNFAWQVKIQRTLGEKSLQVLLKVSLFAVLF